MTEREETAINPNEWPGPWCDNEDCSCNTPGFVCREFQGYRADGRCPQCGWLGEHHNGRKDEP